MTRKSKQPGGHNPLTYHERSKYASSSSYGTTTARLNSESQTRFGDCCLSLVPAKDPVVTPSGHIYSREAIVTYLLSKTQELKQRRIEYEAALGEAQKRHQERLDSKKHKQIQQFVTKDQGAAFQPTQCHSQTFHTKQSQVIDTESKQEGRETLKRTSFWLSEFQPEHSTTTAGNKKMKISKKEQNDNDNHDNNNNDDHDDDYQEEIQELLKQGPPPDRPASPMSGNPLRLKDLIPIQLQRENNNNNDKSNGKPICALSGKTLTTQRIVFIKKTGQVVLHDVYEKLIKPTMICPTSGKKLKRGDVLELSRASSGFARSGDVVVAKRYRPTMT